uniref:Zinc transporter ZIP3 n=1 Tax=Gongylonema pulchrum TaxID=637853 RepID=A0A183EKQ0_9BILA
LVKEDPPILMKSRPHAHSHGVRSITFVLAISFHAVIEGLAFGVQVLLHERDNEHPNLLKLIFMLTGFALIGGLRFFDEHSHEHSYGSHEKLAATSASP